MGQAINQRGAASRAAGAVLRAWPAALAVFFLLLFHRFWNHSVIFRDSFVLYAPQKFLVGQAWRAGELRAWNPYQFLGMPLIGDILAGFYYPLNLLYALLPLEPAHRLFILVHYPLAAIGMVLFLRALGLTRAPALAGALGFSLSGYLIGQHPNLPFLIGPALAPLALFFFVRAAGGRWTWAPAAGLAVALQALAGEPQSAGVTGAIMLMMGAGQSLHEQRARPLALAGLAVSLSLAFAAAALLPALELLPAGARAGGIGLAEAQFYSLHPASLAEFVWPNAFGRLYPNLQYWGLFTIDDIGPHISYPWSASCYLGFPLLGLAAFGLWAGRRRAAAAAGAAALLFLLLALGRFLPVYGFFHRVVPGFGLFRYPAKYSAGFTAAVAVLAALGLEAIRRRAEADPRGLLRPLAVYFAALAAVLAGAVFAGPAAMTRLGGLLPATADYADALSNLKLGGMQVAAAGVAAGLAMLAAARGWLRPRPAALLVLAVLAADLGSNASALNAGPTDIFSGRSAAGRMISPTPPAPGSPRVFRQTMNFPPSLVDSTRPPLGGLADIPKLCRWERESMKDDFAQLEGFEQLAGFNEARPIKGIALLAAPEMSVLNLYNVGAVITRSQLDLSFLPWQQEENKDFDFIVARNPQPRPRAYLAARAVAAGNDEVAERLMLAPEMEEGVVISAPGVPDTPPQPVLVPVRVERYASDEVELAAEAPSRSWLVLNDRFFPGWRAWVDGREQRIERANVLVRAVLLEPGRHRVRFEYRPWPVRMGLWVTLAAIGCALIFLRYEALAKVPGRDGSKIFTQMNTDRRG